MSLRYQLPPMRSVCWQLTTLLDGPLSPSESNDLRFALSTFFALIVLSGDGTGFRVCQLIGRLACSEAGLFFSVEGRVFGLVGLDRVGEAAGVVLVEACREGGERFGGEDGAGVGTGEGMTGMFTRDSWKEAIRTGMLDRCGWGRQLKHLQLVYAAYPGCVVQALGPGRKRCPDTWRVPSGCRVPIRRWVAWRRQDRDTNKRWMIGSNLYRRVMPWELLDSQLLIEV